jgi:hypothetical protein
VTTVENQIQPRRETNLLLYYCTKCRHYPVSDSAHKCPRCGATRYGAPQPTVAPQPIRIPRSSEFTRFLSGEREIHGYAQVCGILAIALAIAGFLIPMIGVLFVAPLAIVMNVIALYGGCMRIAFVRAMLVLVSPTFWLNVAARRGGASGASQSSAILF